MKQCGVTVPFINFQRQEMTASTETLDAITDATLQALPYHSNTNTLRSSDSPKRDTTDMYLKSKALLESRRKSLQIFQISSFVHLFCLLVLHYLKPRSYINSTMIKCFWSTEPHTKDIDVFLKRDIETGFGFRVLGGDGPQQPVSIFKQLRPSGLQIWKINSLILYRRQRK